VDLFKLDFSNSRRIHGSIDGDNDSGVEPPWLKGSSAQNPALLKQGLDQFLQQEVEAPTGMRTNVYLSSRSLFVYAEAFFDMYAYSQHHVLLEGSTDIFLHDFRTLF